MASAPAIVDPSQTVDYSSTDTPSSYTCGGCGATGVKLWRESGRLWIDGMTLRCADCAATEAGVDISSMGPDGRFDSEFGRSDQFPHCYRVPAIPSVENDGFWQYTRVPQEGCDWWTRLPLR